MKIFMAEDNICAQNLLRLVSHGNAIIAEILRLKDYTPSVFLFTKKDVQQKYQDVIMDFSYFKVSENAEKKISSNPILQDLDDEVKEKYLELITRFYLLFDNVYQYVVDLNTFIENLNDNKFIQQTIDTVLKDVEGKQLLCEMLYLYGTMLLLCDLFISGAVRERLLVAFYRYSTSQSQSSIDNVCQLLRDTGYEQTKFKRPSQYPTEYFKRVNIDPVFIDRVIGTLRSEDVYNQLSVYTIPEHKSVAFANQASMLFVCLFFAPEYLHSDTVKMREIVDKFFPSNWVIPIYMGITINVIDYWDCFKAAKTSLQNTCNTKTMKELYTKRFNSITILEEKINMLLKEGTLTDDFVLDNIAKILNLIINSNFLIRCLLLHNSNITFFDNNKKSKQLKEAITKDNNHFTNKLLNLFMNTAELELRVREILNKLLSERAQCWIDNKATALETVNQLSELLSETKPATRIKENQQLKSWFENVAKQIASIDDNITAKGIKKITQLIQALDEVEEFHGIKSTLTIVQLLNETKDSMKNALKTAALKDEYLVTLETVADFSYAWCAIDDYTIHMQNSIKDNPKVTGRLRSLFLKLASAMEIPLLRINQAKSEDLISVSQYYSNELIKYIQKVLQIIPEMVFNIVEKIIELQTYVIKEIPTKVDKDKLVEYAQLPQRMEVAKLTHSASMFTTGILDMRSTLVGVIRVDPAELLEEGLLKELARNLNNKFEEIIEPQKKTVTTPQILLVRLQKLAESIEGYKRSLEYIQDYINMHGLKIWQKQMTNIINASGSKEINIRKGVSLHSPSAGFMGSLARQIVNLLDSRTCSYINIHSAFYDIKSQTEFFNTKTWLKLNDAIGIVGLHGLDTLYAFMITNQLQQVLHTLKTVDNTTFGNLDEIETSALVKETEIVISKNQRLFQILSDAVVLVGTLQLIRKHIAFQINTCCKFDSAHLDASLRNMNESLLNELRRSLTDPKPVSAQLMYTLENYLCMSGIYEPYKKVYTKDFQDFYRCNLSHFLSVFLISQFGRLHFIETTGDLIARKLGDNIDGYPLLVGIYTILHQSCVDDLDEFINFICRYIKSAAISRNKSETTVETTYSVRIIQLFCEIFDYPFSKLEDQLPMQLLTIK